MDFEMLLEEMISVQIKARGVTDPAVIKALRKIKRHEFVRKEDLEYAYADTPLTSAEGQTISQPFMVAYMTQELEVTKGSKVLEIGTGSGYQAAVLACLAGKVYTIELHEHLYAQAKKRLHALGIKNVIFTAGDGTMGWPDNAPYDRILLTGAIPEIPEAIEEQLNKEDGIIIAPAGEMYSQRIVKIRYHEGKRHFEEKIGCVFVPLFGKYGFER